VTPLEAIPQGHDMDDGPPRNSLPWSLFQTETCQPSAWTQPLLVAAASAGPTGF
jgi:hypothetical protein